MEGLITNLLFSLLVAGTLVRGDDSTCVEDENSALKACFDPLKEDLNKATVADVNNFLCGNPQKERVDCIIKKFKMCPDFKNETFLDELKHTASGFHVKDLFYVESADAFCKCAPTFTCLGKVDTDQLAIMPKDNKAWAKMPNNDYICGDGKAHLECVQKSLPECDKYLQYKHNQTSKDNFFDVTNIEHAAMYAENHCIEDEDDKEDYGCIEKRAKWYALEACADDARHYSQDVDKSCGLRKCIEINMGTCPEGHMDYYIAAVNVFSEYKVDTKPCSLTSSSSSLLATISTILLAYYLSMAL